jgi:demethylmenaquinone methyltransferase/2-methoxy-6-polyprenyl-1,4-benzoquinol methylase
MALPSKDQKERFVREMFNGIAHRYDFMNTLMTFGLDRSWRQFAVRRARIQPGMQVLDVCAGTAALTLEIARVVGETGRVIGVDFSENMLEVGRKRVQQSNYASTIQLIHGNAMALPFADDSFDAVTVGWGLRNIPDIDQALREMLRVVKPGGWVVSLDMAKPSAPVFKQLYWLYFDWIVPMLGKWTAGKKSAYQYLHDSSREFDDQEQLKNRFARIGFQHAAFHNLMGGVVAVVEGQKLDHTT